MHSLVNFHIQHLSRIILPCILKLSSQNFPQLSGPHEKASCGRVLTPFPPPPGFQPLVALNLKSTCSANHFICSLLSNFNRIWVMQEVFCRFHGVILNCSQEYRLPFNHLCNLPLVHPSPWHSWRVQDTRPRKVNLLSSKHARNESWYHHLPQALQI